jgi:hypothetical protein
MMLVTTYLFTLWLAAAALLRARLTPVTRRAVTPRVTARRALLLAAATPLP